MGGACSSTNGGVARGGAAKKYKSPKDDDRWYLPSQLVPRDLLEPRWKQGRLRVRWDEAGYDAADREQAFRSTADELKANADEVTFVCAAFDFHRADFSDADCVMGVLVCGSPEDRTRLAFDTIDKDRSGMLDKDELIDALRLTAQFDPNPKRRECKSEKYFREAADEIMRIADADNSGEIDFEEWQNAFKTIGPRLTQLARQHGIKGRELGVFEAEASFTQHKEMAQMAASGRLRPTTSGGKLYATCIGSTVNGPGHGARA